MLLAGVTSEGHAIDLEHYDVEDAIRIATDAGRQLRRDTDSAVHRFRMEWVEQLVGRYRANPGRPIVHLSDLLDSTQIDVSERASEILQEYWRHLGGLSSSPDYYERLRGIRALARGSVQRFVRLDTWKLFGSITCFNLDKLEPFVTALRLSGGSRMRMVEHPKLPFNLATVSGARLIGYQGDANSRNSAFTNMDPALHQDYRKRVLEVVGGMTTTNTFSTRGGFGIGRYQRTNVGKLVTRMMSVAGLSGDMDQKLANNPLPLWLHMCEIHVIGSCLGALWDAEGSVNYHDLKLSQAVPLPGDQKGNLPRWPANIPFKQLGCRTQVLVEETPPRLLTSAALLLHRLGVVARLSPTKATMTSTGPTAYWQLRIFDALSIRRFQSHVQLFSESKRRALETSA